MKVYINKLSSGLKGGMILAAANSPQEAHEAFHKDSRFSYMWTDWSWENPSYVSDEYYYPDDWVELTMLTADVESPQILAEASYME